MPETSDVHVIDIDKRLDELPPIPSERCIFRVHDRLRNENKNAYEPEVVAIGPYHHGKNNLKPMEELKLRYLKQLLNRREETSAEEYIVAMRESEPRARKFYAEHVSLDPNAFVEMMLLDSCFILEFLRKDEMMTKNIEIAVRRDLVLFENQLPFFVVLQLFNMTKNSTDSLNNLVGMFASFFAVITPGGLLPENPREDDISEHLPAENPREDDISEHLPAENPREYGIEQLLAENPREDDIFKHLLGLLHHCCCYEFQSLLLHHCCCYEFQSQRNIVLDKKDEYLKSAKELQDAGIKFKKIEGRNLFDIRFDNENWTMKIPTLKVEDNTESVFRNLIAYEQYLPDTSRNHFTAYLKFMDFLLNTSEDVEILTHRGIILNLLGDNKAVAAMLNKLGKNIIVSYVGYEEVYKKVNQYCRERRNLWMATLNRDYCNHPLAVVTILAFYLTATQTVFSLLSVLKI